LLRSGEWAGPARHCLYKHFFPAGGGFHEGIEWGAPVGGLRVVGATDPSVLERPEWAEVSKTAWTRRLVPDAFGARRGARYKVV